MPSASSSLAEQAAPAEGVEQGDAADHRRQHQRQQHQRAHAAPGPRKLVRASTSAIGTPSSTHSDAWRRSDVRRLSDSAVSEDSEVISSKKLPHSTRRDHRRPAGAARSAAPSAAGTKIQAGSPTVPLARRPSAQGWPKPASPRTSWPVSPSTKSTNSCGEVGVLAVRRAAAIG